MRVRVKLGLKAAEVMCSRRRKLSCCQETTHSSSCSVQGGTKPVELQKRHVGKQRACAFESGLRAQSRTKMPRLRLAFLPP